MRLALPSLLVVTACNGVSGSVAGNTLEVADQLYAPWGDSNPNAFFLLLSDSPDECDHLKAHVMLANSRSMRFALTISAQETLGSNVPAVGEYVAGAATSDAGRALFGNFLHTGSDCANTLTSQESAVRTGALRITRASATGGGVIDGTFDVEFKTQTDRLSGAFSAKFCDVAIGVPTSGTCR